MSARSEVREEVLNVKLAELLLKREILSVPESILSTRAGRRLPDIIIGDYAGVRVVLEGRVEDHSGVDESLERDCRKRIEEGIASICIGVAYPPNARHGSLAEIEENLTSAKLKVKVMTASKEMDWVESDLDGLSEILRHAYDALVTEDVVDSAVKMLSETIESVVPALASHSGTEGRLREILIVPKSPENK